VRRLCIPLALGLLLAGCASQPTTPSSADRMELAREAYVAKDYDRAFAITRAEAELGNPRAQYALGYMYYNGEGVLPDPDMALKWIREAATKGDPKAVEALSRLAGLATRASGAQAETTAPGAAEPPEQTAPTSAPTEAQTTQ